MVMVVVSQIVSSMIMKLFVRTISVSLRQILWKNVAWSSIHMINVPINFQVIVSSIGTTQLICMYVLLFSLWKDTSVFPWILLIASSAITENSLYYGTVPPSTLFEASAWGKRRCQQRMPVPMAMNVPNVPPPWTIVFPTLVTSSLPRNPNLQYEHNLMQ